MAVTGRRDFSLQKARTDSPSPDVGTINTERARETDGVSVVIDHLDVVVAFVWRIDEEPMAVKTS